MDDRFNTIAGWVLFAGIIALGASVLSGKFFHADKPQRPDTLGYVIEGVVEEGGPAEMSLEEALNLATVEDGEKKFSGCISCHTIAPGGANGTGPNLHGIMGKGIGKVAGFGYSPALSGNGGNWGWEEMSAWIKNPKAFIEGNKMSYPGMSKVEDRAALLLYLNSQGGSLTVPAYEAPAEDAAPAEGEEVAAEDAEAQADEAGEAEATQDAAAEENEGGA
jgi:cytochrome c